MNVILDRMLVCGMLLLPLAFGCQDKRAAGNQFSIAQPAAVEATVRHDQDTEVPAAAQYLANSTGQIGLIPIKLIPEVPKAGDTVQVLLASSSAREQIAACEWMKNGERLSETASALKLSDGFRRGDMIEAAVSVRDINDRIVRGAVSFFVANSAPVIELASGFTRIDPDRFTFLIKARDADGDDLQYSIKTPLDDAIVERSTGKVTFSVPRDKSGRFLISASVVDGHGGEGLYDFEVTIGD